MAKCKKEKELVITTNDKPGMLAEVGNAIASQGINISALCAYSMEGKAIFMMLTADNKKAMNAVKSKGWKAEESNVVTVEVKDKVGAVKEIGDKLKANNINLSYCYGTTCSCAPGSCSPDCVSRLVLKSDSSDAIIAAIG